MIILGKTLPDPPGLFLTPWEPSEAIGVGPGWRAHLQCCHLPFHQDLCIPLLGQCLLHSLDVGCYGVFFVPLKYKRELQFLKKGLLVTIGQLALKFFNQLRVNKSLGDAMPLSKVGTICIYHSHKSYFLQKWILIRKKIIQTSSLTHPKAAFREPGYHLVGNSLRLESNSTTVHTGVRVSTYEIQVSVHMHTY